MKLRPYQEACVHRVREELTQNGSTLAVLATGTGKTVIFSHLARDWPGRVLVLAHRDELIRQAADKLHTVTGKRPAIEMGSDHSDERADKRSRIVVSSVQTMCRPNRQQRFDPSKFGLLIVDEAHHAVARTYQSAIAHFRQNENCSLLGVTATPRRTDQLAMGQVFNSVAFDYGIEPAIEDGWLVPVNQRVVLVQDLDFSQVRSTAGDLNEADLEKIVMQEKALHRMAAPLAELAGDRPCLVFCVSVAHAQAMAVVLDRYKKDAVVALHGGTRIEDRIREVARFKAGEIQYLVNCGLFLEGFDAPSTAVVAMCRPTKSLALYTQVLGRGTRPLPGVVDGLDTAEARRAAIATSAKPGMLAIDFVGNAGKHKIITASDLLGGKYGEPARAYAKKTLQEEGGERPVGEALERASDELAFLRNLAEIRRRRSVQARAEFVTHEVSPFGRGAAPSMPATPSYGEPATAKQINFLCWKGWSREAAARLSKRQASGIIGKLKEGGE